MKMTGRNEKELEGVSLLGNQTNVYRADYAPEVLETFPNKHPENDYFVKFNCPEFYQPLSKKPDSLILPRSIFHTFPVNAWWRVNP